MRIHFIAIGGSAMHNLALALQHAGHEVTGSDDQILEPSRSRLAAAGILPPREGWRVEAIHSELDAVILGMHARVDNPELHQAQALNLRIYSYPEFLYEATREKFRVVVGGSHGKTTVTSMLLHVLRKAGKTFDFMVGAQLPGFERMVALSKDAPVAIFEGDEYLSSPIDSRPKFFHYKPQLTILTGVAWDHINVFPTEESYISLFDRYLDTLPEGAQVVWCAEDATLAQVIGRCPRTDLTFIPYTTPSHRPGTGNQTLLTAADGTEASTLLIGTHNYQNWAGARALAVALGLDPLEFQSAMADFSGASRRLESWQKGETFDVYRDFAHAPSKVRATVAGVKASQPQRELVAYFELHTFSSLNRDFLPTYRGALDAADRAYVFFDPAVLAHKNMPPLDAAYVKEAFANPQLHVVTHPDELKSLWEAEGLENQTVLLMSSGWFGGAKWPGQP
ncbi:MAG: hypothetical protein RJA19_1359 [Bacteroidota bacterium]